MIFLCSCRSPKLSQYTLVFFVESSICHLLCQNIILNALLYHRRMAIIEMLSTILKKLTLLNVHWYIDLFFIFYFFATGNI